MVIVAAVDRSNRAGVVVSEAAALALAFDEPVHVLHVLSRAAFVDLGTTQAEAGDPIDMDRVRALAASVATEAAGDLDVPFEAVGLMGDAATRIEEYAAEQDARYVVIAGRRRSPAGKALFGSVAQSVILNADCPVVVSVEQ